MREVLNAIFSTRTTAEWMEILEKGAFPAGPVLSISQMHADPQTRARDMVVTVEHARLGAVETR